MIWLISSELILLTMLSAGLVFFLSILYIKWTVNLIFRRFSMMWTPEFLFLKAINEHISNHFLELSRKHFLYGFICFCLSVICKYLAVYFGYGTFSVVCFCRKKKHGILARFSWHISPLCFLV